VTRLLPQPAKLRPFFVFVARCPSSRWDRGRYHAPASICLCAKGLHAVEVLAPK